MKDKTTGIALAFLLIIFILVFAITDGFKGATMVASSNVHVSTAAPTVNDDVFISSLLMWGELESIF